MTSKDDPENSSRHSTESNEDINDIDNASMYPINDLVRMLSYNLNIFGQHQNQRTEHLSDSNSINRLSQSSNPLQWTSNDTAAIDANVNTTNTQNEINELYRTVLGDESMGQFNPIYRSTGPPGLSSNHHDTDTMDIERRRRFGLIETLDHVLRNQIALTVVADNGAIPTTSNVPSTVDGHSGTTFNGIGRRRSRNDIINDDEDIDVDVDATSHSNHDTNLPKQ